MKTRIYLYLILVLAVLVQVLMMKHVGGFPDIILLVVVFTGIFRGWAEGAALGLVAGLLRGAFSVATLPVDIFLFPMVGGMSSVLSKLFYRHNPTVQMFTSAVALFAVIAAQTVYLNNIAGNEIGVSSVVLKSWKQFFLTILIVPFMFMALRAVLKLEE